VPTVGKGKDGKPGFDFDLQVKIIQLFKVDEYQSEIRVIDDSGEIWHSSVYNLKYRSIKEGQYVRIRAASLVNHMNYANTFGMRPYSNILSLPFPCKLAEGMMFDEVSETRIFEKNQLANKEAILMHPIIVSQVSGKLDTISGLDEIKGEAVHRVRISVSHVSAPTLKIREKGELKSCPAKTPALKKGQDKVICFQMLVKDACQLSSNLFTRVSVVDSGKFLGVSPDDFNEKKVREQLA
jgi:hypothetical protein